MSAKLHGHSFIRDGPSNVYPQLEAVLSSACAPGVIGVVDNNLETSTPAS